MFSTVADYFWNYVVEPFESGFSLMLLYWGRSAKFCWMINELNFPLRCFAKVVLINSNFTLFIQFGSVTFRFTLNTLIICIIYIVEKTACYISRQTPPISWKISLIVEAESHRRSSTSLPSKLNLCFPPVSSLSLSLNLWLFNRWTQLDLDALPFSIMKP